MLFFIAQLMLRNVNKTMPCLEFQKVLPIGFFYSANFGSFSNNLTRVFIAVVAVVFAVIFVNTTVNMTKTTAINDNEFF